MWLLWMLFSSVSASYYSSPNPYNVDDPQSIMLMPCTASAAKWQAWEFGTEHNFIKLKSNGLCLDVQNYATQDMSTVSTWECHPDDKDPTHQNQAWKSHSNGTITELMSGKCLDRSNYGTVPGTIVWLFKCTGVYNQDWIYNEADSTIRAKDSGLCLDGGSPVPLPPRACDKEPAKSMLFCDHTQPLNKRVESIVANLTTDEKVGLFSNGASGVDRLNFPSYQWWSEALHGVGHSPGVKFGGPVPYATSFPQVILTGAAFNQSLWHSIGTVISTEARAFNNVQHAGLTYWAPNINIQRDPRWGRGQETPGEDPFTTAEYAANFVSGMQGDDKTYLKVSSCCKHYAAYDLENWGGVDRHHFDAKVSAQDMADTYLPGFQSCIERGHGSSLMCSYNAINGVPSCANADIMTTKARKQWGFQGYITSDCGAVNDVYAKHKYTKTPDATCKAVLEAGMDIDCGGFLNGHLKNSIQDKSTPISAVDNALKNLFAVQFRLGMFDPVDIQPYLQINYTDSVNTPAHQKLALEAAQQGIVLLKNNGKLPLKASSVKSIAVIGPNGAATGTMQGNYQGNAPYLISPVEGIKKYVPATTYTKGCDIASTSKSGFDAAKKAAAAADVTVIVVGIDGGQEGEGRDRTIIHFPGVQNELITAVSDVAKGPVIVISMAGGQVDLSTPKNSSRVDALLWCGYPGQSGGQAIADILFGTYNPGGRLPYTIYPADYIKGLSMFDMSMRPNASSGNPGHTYRFYTGNAVYSFGEGLSYTTFGYSSSVSELKVPLEMIEKYTQEEMSYISRSRDAVEDITITVTNTGKVAGSDVVMAFMKSPNAGQEGAPLQTLVGFKRVYLAPGGHTTIKFPVTTHDLTLVTEQGTRMAVPGEWQMLIGPDAKAAISIKVAN